MGLNIEINADYLLTSDSMNVIINRKHIVDPTKSPNWAKREAEGADPTPREEWREAAYHPTIDKAATWILNQTIRDSDVTTLREVIEITQRFNREITAKLGR
jgi:hypothetical protein